MSHCSLVIIKRTAEWFHRCFALKLTVILEALTAFAVACSSAVESILLWTCKECKYFTQICTYLENSLLFQTTIWLSPFLCSWPWKWAQKVNKTSKNTGWCVLLIQCAGIQQLLKVSLASALRPGSLQLKFKVKPTI